METKSFIFGFNQSVRCKTIVLTRKIFFETKKQNQLMIDVVIGGDYWDAFQTPKTYFMKNEKKN